VTLRSIRLTVVRSFILTADPSVDTHFPAKGDSPRPKENDWPSFQTILPAVKASSFYEPVHDEVRSKPTTITVGLGLRFFRHDCPFLLKGIGNKSMTNWKKLRGKLLSISSISGTTQLLKFEKTLDLYGSGSNPFKFGHQADAGPPEKKSYQH